VDEHAGDDEQEEADDLRSRRHVIELHERIGHDGEGRRAINEAAQVNLPQRDQKARVGGQKQHKIQFAGAHQFGDLRDIGEKKRLEHLLNEVRGAHQQDDLPFGPVADTVGVLIDDGDEGQLEGKP
jgi:hypothetical protein